MPAPTNPTLPLPATLRSGRQQRPQQSRPDPQRAARRRRARLVTLLAYVVVGAVLLVPFHPDHLLILAIVDALPAGDHALRSATSTGLQAVLNVLLFLPIGFLTARRTGRRLTGVLAGLALSGGSELLQVVIPSRVPSLSDVALNTLGALIGALLAGRAVRDAAPRSHLPGILARCLALVGVLAVVGALLVAGLVVAVPSVADAPARVKVLAAAHSSTASTGPLPAKVTAALLATEDSRYYSTPGIDPFGAGRWIVETVQGSPDAGGATIEQQLAKMLYTNGHQGTLDRVEQVGLALKLDRSWSKEQILRMYLDTAYFGHGYYGVDAAAHGYFGRSAAVLSWPQAALLAGLVQAPTAYDPTTHPALALSRRAHVLDRLAATGTISTTKAARLARTGLQLAGS